MYDVSQIIFISPDELDFIHHVYDKISSIDKYRNHPLVYDFTAVYEKIFADPDDWAEYEVTDTAIRRVHNAITYPDDKDSQKYMKKCKTNDLFMIYVPLAFIYGLAYAVSRSFPDIFPPKKIDLIE